MIYDHFNVHVRSLEALGVTSEHNGSLLTPIIMSRIPENLSLQVARQVSKEVWSITEVLNVIKEEVDAKEMSEKVTVKEQRTAAVQRGKPAVQELSHRFMSKARSR